VNSDKQPPATAWAMVLAAGSSQRFGGDKLLASFRGKPLLQHCLETLERCRISGKLGGVLVVVGAGQQDRARLGRDSGADVVVAPGAQLSDSIRAGTRWLGDRSEVAAVLIALGDQPLLREATVDLLVSRWQLQGDANIVRPRYSSAPEEPGHPVLIDRSRWRLVDSLRSNEGLGGIMSRESEVIEVEIQGSNPDVDRPEDLAGLEEVR